ncbi:MAG: protein translocase subunit SecD [Gammaproteobacteria bacterium]|nr:protein translocase subunit SecD [Gammaproteobacteria bacterium]MYF27381.1 protein translocase subunit SecD [Gammaproteobacteria bacterium]MYK44599.1 protein translocase subunit SecD [Gammaproteobacteria bacterium]
MPGFGLPGGPRRGGATGRIAPWRYLVFALVVSLGGLYAAPNLFPPDFALQISVDNSDRPVNHELLAELADRLEFEGIATIGTELAEAGGLIRVSNANDQLHAGAILQEHLNPLGEDRQFVVAFNLASTTPDWLRAIGAEPMTLGLDLKGGAHFLLQVDMEEALAKRLTDEVEKIKDMLREERIRYRSTDDAVQGNTLSVTFATPQLRDRAIEVIEDEFRQPDYLLETTEPGGRAGFVITVQDAKLREIESSAIEQNLTGLRNRINQLGVAEPLVQRLGRARIAIDLPGVQDSAEAKRKIDKFANLEFRLEAVANDRASEIEQWPYEGRIVDLNKRIILTGDHVVHAAQGRDPENGMPQVDIKLDSRGGEMFHEATAPNIGRRMAVIFIEHKSIVTTEIVDGERVEKLTSRADKRVISLATIRAALGYNFRITGLSVREAQELAFLLRAGALAAPMYIVEERTVGASLGEENIERGMIAVGIGFGLVLAFMLVYYKVFGLIANIALTLNLVILVAVMSVLEATLTLPGIAGIVLTVGMAVDANVLIFSRIREELKSNPPAQAIPAGYDRAFLTILDANITTLFVALILLTIGSGPIAGFAVTLSIGIITSMFTAIFGSRLLVHLIYGRARTEKVWI